MLVAAKLRAFAAANAADGGNHLQQLIQHPVSLAQRALLSWQQQETVENGSGSGFVSEALRCP